MSCLHNFMFFFFVTLKPKINMRLLLHVNVYAWTYTRSVLTSRHKKISFLLILLCAEAISFVHFSSFYFKNYRTTRETRITTRNCVYNKNDRIKIWEHDCVMMIIELKQQVADGCIKGDDSKLLPTKNKHLYRKKLYLCLQLRHPQWIITEKYDI